MVMSPAGLGTKNNCAGEGQQQFISQSTTIELETYSISDVRALSAVLYSSDETVFRHTSGKVVT
jgi:hypothetical protein